MFMKGLVYLVISSVAFSFSSVDLKDFYPFGELNGDTVLPRGENQCELIKMKIPFYVGDNVIGSELYISTNGVIGFEKLVCLYKNGVMPTMFILGMTYGLVVAPFYTFTSTSKFGTVQFRATYDNDILNKINRDIRDTGFLNYNATNALIATWIDVTFAAYTGDVDSTPKNSFQAVVTSDGYYTFVIFYFAKITWNQGDYTPYCTGNTSSGIGNNCQAITTYIINKSGQTWMLCEFCPSALDSLLISNSSNVNRPGVWIARIGTFESVPTLSIQPVYQDMMGHRSSDIIIPGRFDSFANFLGSSDYGDPYDKHCEVISTSSNNSELSCPSRFRVKYGTTKYIIYNDFFRYHTKIFVTPPVTDVYITVLNVSVLDYSVSIGLKWNAALIDMLNHGFKTVNISMYIFDPVKYYWKEPILIIQNANNSGELEIKLVEPNTGLFFSKHLLIGVSGNIAPNFTTQNTIFSKMFIFDHDSYNLKHKLRLSGSGDANVLATVDMMGHCKLNISFRTTPGNDGLGCQFEHGYAANYPTTPAIPSSNNKYVTCYVPFLYTYGVTHVLLFSGYDTTTIAFNYGSQFEQTGNIFKKSDTLENYTEFSYGDLPLTFNIDVLPSYPRLTVEQVATQNTSNGQFQLQMQFTWETSEIPKEYPVLNAFIYQFDDEQNHWMKELMVSPQYIPPNAGSVPVTLSQEAITVFFNYKVMFGLGYVQGDENFVIFSKMFIPGVST